MHRLLRVEKTVTNCVKTTEWFHMLNFLPLVIHIATKSSLWQAHPCFQVFRLDIEKFLCLHILACIFPSLKSHMLTVLGCALLDP